MGERRKVKGRRVPTSSASEKGAHRPLKASCVFLFISFALECDDVAAAAATGGSGAVSASLKAAIASLVVTQVGSL
ncbi:hypothetical protein M0802_009742 [Mischocyttarus mexicanus]|nr:hypothetical protein M0802_009742 [Mischocyttarus mexicanus]